MDVRSSFFLNPVVKLTKQNFLGHFLFLILMQNNSFIKRTYELQCHGNHCNNHLSNLKVNCLGKP